MLSEDFNRLVERIVALRRARRELQEARRRQTTVRRNEVHDRLRLTTADLAGMRRAWRGKPRSVAPAARGPAAASAGPEIPAAHAGPIPAAKTRRRKKR